MTGEPVFRKIGVICQWFALCDNIADGTVAHPVLGNVPTCKRCAEKLGLSLVEDSSLVGARRLRRNGHGPELVSQHHRHRAAKQEIKRAQERIDQLKEQAWQRTHSRQKTSSESGTSTDSVGGK